MASTWGDGPNRQHLSAQAMDEKRKENVAYQYLCHLEEARMWISRCLGEELPAAIELEAALTNGVILAKLTHFFAPDVVKKSKIYDPDLERFNATGLHFKHTDNINYWLTGIKKVGLPAVFYPTTTDIYDRKNIPKTIYCLHALSVYLHRLGKAPLIQDLVGEVDFSQEDINNMQRELDEQGIQMPAFGKIASHCDQYVEKILESIESAVASNDQGKLMVSLNDPIFSLAEVKQEHAACYMSSLKKVEPPFTVEAIVQAIAEGNMSEDEAQHMQEVFSNLATALASGDGAALLELMKDKAFESANVIEENVDFYLKTLAGNDAASLTVDLVVGGVRDGNHSAKEFKRMQAMLADVTDALASGDEEKLIAALKDSAFAAADVQGENASYYITALKTAESPLTVSSIVASVADGNQTAAAYRHLQAVLGDVTDAIASGDEEKLMAALKDSAFAAADVQGENASYYITALKTAESPLTVSSIVAAVADGNQTAATYRHLQAVLGDVTDAIASGDKAKLMAALKDSLFADADVQDNNGSYYVKALSTVEAPLTVSSIVAAVAEGNGTADVYRHLQAMLGGVTEAIESGDEEKLITTLKDSVFAAATVQDNNASYYITALKTVEAPLTVSSIVAAVADGNQTAATYRHLQAMLGDVTEATESGNEEKLVTTLKDSVFSAADVLGENASYYIKTLKTVESPLTVSSIVAAVADGNRSAGVYNHLQDMLSAVAAAIAGLDGQKLLELLKDSVFSAANVIPENVRFYVKNLKKAPAGSLTVNSIEEAVKDGNLEAEAIKVVIAAVNAKDKDQLLEALKHPLFKDISVREDNVDFFLAALEKTGEDLTIDDLRAAAQLDNIAANMSSGKGSTAQISSLQKFLHLLEANERDYEEEKEIQMLKQAVVSTIRQQQELEENLNIMDIKIGLLVKNRLDLDDVVHQQSKLKKKGALGGPSKGLKSLSKESRAKLEGYQHLFYSLQTNPNYLARLIFQMPGGRTTRFIENVIFTLFNYASNQREEFLLMNLFTSALELELKTMDNIEDITKGNATVIKMVITFNRGARGVSSLKELILPLVERIINDNDLRINVNPVDIYKSWINQKESETGESCGMPYEVSTEQALSHPEVQERIMKTVGVLRGITEGFVTNLTESVTKIPYGIRYFSMRMRQALSEQFPGTSKEDILKIVGNLLYYRFMNPAVVAPDAFDIVELSLDKGLTVEQRRNLGSIAKVLHHASANKLFDGENSALAPLNAVIEQAHQKFLTFFQKASTTEDAESHYNQDKYAEVTQLAKPVVYISVKEICNTHKLLLEHEDSITDNEGDTLHRLLKDLGPVPDIHEILGNAYAHPGPSVPQEVVQQWEERVAEGGKSEISLTLKNAFDVTGQDDKESILNIFLQTKRMAAGILQAQPGENLKAILDTKPTEEQEAKYTKIQEAKRQFELKQATQEADRSDSSTDTRPKAEASPLPVSKVLALKDVKEGLRCNLAILEKEGLCKAADNYQDILNSMAKDIRNQHRHRQQRKKELEGMKHTLAALEEKGKYYEDQREYYQLYVDACLSNLTKPKNKKSVVRKTVKYNAAKLHEKGVLLEIEGLSSGQFKGVSFEIESGDTGKFNVYAKFMGVSMEKVELVFEELLQLQYEGVSVFKMYGCAKINVNLLVFLINKKFYGT
ncbi:ras GTPase-activating-like protein IQGAP1 isoform X2 [Sycon ciliatum]|uniref:ras GTPase-activating-like protein IQGAP1 isoform X2 n=1 Tax=Sycon ciliatum TaxID=27933 RepID=UPI0031F6975B